MCIYMHVYTPTTKHGTLAIHPNKTNPAIFLPRTLNAFTAPAPPSPAPPVPVKSTLSPSPPSTFTPPFPSSSPPLAASIASRVSTEAPAAVSTMRRSCVGDCDVGVSMCVEGDWVHHEPLIG